MKVKLNGKTRDIQEITTLMELIHREESPTEGLVAMVNDEIISSSLWETKELSQEDEIELLCFVSGG